MTVSVDRVTRGKVMRLISGLPNVTLTEEDKKTFNACLAQTTVLYIGTVDGEFVCTWGLIPPTLMSESAYLWLYSGELKEHQFVFIRHSQRAIEMALKEYPTITGVTRVGQPKTIRWLKWLGAEFGSPDGMLLPFTIRKK